MKKTILSLLAAVACMSINAQVIKVYKSGTADPVATYTNDASNTYKVVFEEAPATPSNLLPGEFSVSAAKKVKFTKSNLYWSGSAFKFEANQYDYPTSWVANHVGHFYWTNLTDYQSGTESYMPYAETYSSSSQSGSDKFFCGEDNKITVEGTADLYALSRAEWTYLLNTRTVNGGTGEGYSWKKGVTVAEKTNCLIIAPDGYTGTLESSYDATAWATAEASGLVCLPAAGDRYWEEEEGLSLYGGDYFGAYWSSSPSNACAIYLIFSSDDVNPAPEQWRDNGFSLRLVK